MGRLVILSGPSCVGKGPLQAALKRFYPALAGQLTKMVLYNCRAPRPGETDGVDYHFRKREEIEHLRDGDRFLLIDIRGDLQALDMRVLNETLTSGDAFFEGNALMVRALRERAGVENIPCLSIFLSPLSQEEITWLKRPGLHVSLADLVTDVMRRKLLRRTRRQKTNLAMTDLENIERRASTAYREMQEAVRYDYVIPNHDGEDSDNWDAFYYPVGDARKTLLSFAALLRGEEPPLVEHWPSDLLP
jgi:guanylate kinase